MAFKYQSRSQDTWEKTANMRGNNREGYVKGQYRLYQTKKGENCVRILPPTWANAEDFCLHIWVHFGVGPDNASVLCNRRMKDERCPICEEIPIAEKQGASDDEVAQLQAKHRTLFWMGDRKDERVGVMAWGAPWTWTRDMVKVCKDRTTGEYFEIDHPEKGFDIYFDREDKSGFPDYSGFQLASRPTSIPESWVQFIEDNPLDTALHHRTYAEVEKIFRGGMEPTEKEAEPARPPRTGNGEAKETAAERPGRPEKEAEETKAERPSFGRPQKEAEEASKEEEKPSSNAATRAAGLRERFLKNRETAS